MTCVVSSSLWGICVSLPHLHLIVHWIDIPSDWTNDETSPTAIATGTEMPGIVTATRMATKRPDLRER